MTYLLYIYILYIYIYIIYILYIYYIYDYIYICMIIYIYVFVFMFKFCFQRVFFCGAFFGAVGGLCGGNLSAYNPRIENRPKWCTPTAAF